MGKETKIGLAVIGVLFLVFGVLLFRYLVGGAPAGSWENDDRAAAQPLSTGETSDKPNVVMAQRDDGPGATSESLWDATPAHAEGNVPSASYMPAPAEPAAAADRYQRSADEAAVSEPGEMADSDRPPVGTSPFQEDTRRTDDSLVPVAPTTDNAPEPSPEDSPNRASAEPLRNPLRQLSADLPLTAPDEAADGKPDQSVADPYAEDERPLPSGDIAEKPEQPGHMELPPNDPSAPSGSVENPRTDPLEPDMIPESSLDAAQDDFGRDPFAEAPREPAAVRPTAPVENQPAAIQDDWSTAGPPDASIVGNQRSLPVEDGMYTVQPNDTLWSISQKVYGNGGYFKAIAEHNRAALPRSDLLSVGMKVAVPPVSELEQKYPDLCPRQRKSALVSPRAVPAAATVPRAAASEVYVVQEGDTLFDIARFELGKASRWAEIYELNRDKLGEDFDYLRPGVELRLPPKSRAAETISRGDTRYLR